MENEQLALVLQNEFSVVAPEQPDREQLLRLLAEKIDVLIRTDFNRLLLMLYRVDVDESKLRELLRTQHGQAAGNIIANLVIERELEKIRLREKNRNAGGKTSPDAERW
jgi:hypothetical protein